MQTVVEETGSRTDSTAEMESKSRWTFHAIVRFDGRQVVTAATSAAPPHPLLQSATLQWRVPDGSDEAREEEVAAAHE